MRRAETTPGFAAVTWDRGEAGLTDAARGGHD